MSEVVTSSREDVFYQSNRNVNLAHRESMKDKDYGHEQTMLERKQCHEKEMLGKSLGWLGRCFGGEKMLPLNISGLLVLLLLSIGLLATVIVIVHYAVVDKIGDMNTSLIKDIWSILTPIITLTLGYLFGNKTGGENVN